MRQPASGVSISYLVKESLLILSFAYLVVIGGSYDGSVVFTLGKINLILGGSAGLVWMGWRIYRKRPFPSTPIDIALAIWLTTTAGSTLFSSNPRLSLEYFNSSLVYVLAFYLVVDLVRNGWPDELWINTLLVASIFGIGLGILQIVLWYRDWFQIGGWDHLIPPATIRVYSTFRHANLYASFLNLLIPLGVAKLFLTPKKIIKLMLGIWLLASLAMVYFTSSRGGWVGTFTVFAVMATLLGVDHPELLKNVRKWLQIRKLRLVGILFAITTLIVLISGLLIRQANHPTHPHRADPRSYIWNVALDMFQSSPWIGLGPGTFGLSFIQHFSIPPDMLLAHAHNFFLNTLAESGLVGAIALLFLGGSIGLAMIRDWRSLPVGKRTLFAGLAASLAGIAMHSQFDTPEIVIITNLILAIILGLLMAGMRKPSKSNRCPFAEKLWASFLPIGLLVSVVVCSRSLYGYAAFVKSVHASYQMNWTEATFWMDAAQNRDPSNRFYQIQRGFAYGALALNPDGSLRDPDALAIAIAALENGLKNEDAYSLHWANLAILRRASGNFSGAEHAMQQAVRLAPESSVLLLNLGRIQDENGSLDLSIESFKKAIELEPAWKDDELFSGSQSWLTAVKDSKETPLVDQGWQAIEGQNYPKAETIFRSRIDINTADAYRGLGIALLGQGQIEEGNRAIQTAAFIDGGSLSSSLRLYHFYCQIGDIERAQSEWNSIQQAINFSSAFGPGELGDAQYAWTIYRRIDFPSDLLPGWKSNYNPILVQTGTNK